MENVIYKIKRFDGQKEWIQSYTIPYEKGKTILWGLLKIRDEQDPSLKFNSACRSAICGSCAVRVNGNSVLACKTSLDNMLELYRSESILIEPLRNFTIIRDLVVDWEPKFEKMKEVAPWLICPDDHDHSQGFTQTNEEVERFTNATDCTLCGICTSECPLLTVNAEGCYDPFILNKAYRFTADTRDASPKSHLEPTLNKEGLWKCIHCMKCVSSCPKEVKLVDHIGKLREQSISMGYDNNEGARQALTFTNNITACGRVNEELLGDNGSPLACKPVSPNFSGEMNDAKKINKSITEEVQK